MDLTNKVAVVTGAARDIGKSIAKKLAANGAKVIVNYLNSEKEALQTAEEITLSRGIASVFKADVRKQSDIQKLLDYTLKTCKGGIDILVNNAGGLVGRRKFEEMDEAFYDEVMDLNFRSNFLVTRTFLKSLNKGASVINISSVAARDGGGGGSILYAA